MWTFTLARYQLDAIAAHKRIKGYEATVRSGVVLLERTRKQMYRVRWSAMARSGILGLRFVVVHARKHTAVPEEY